MRIEYKLPHNSRPSAETCAISPESQSSPRPPRITCLLALAHRLEELVESGQVKDYAELARVGDVSRARISQILKLLTLAPSIQEQILWLTPAVSSITERDLRQVVNEPFWAQQRSILNQLMAAKSPRGD